METRKIEISFYKYVSMGNDFIVIEKPSLSKEMVIKMCKEKWGIHSDGILLLYQTKKRITLRIMNADGTEAKMCGNGLKVVAAHLSKKDPYHTMWKVYIHRQPYIVRKEEDGESVEVPFPVLLKEERGEALYDVKNLHRLKEHQEDDGLQKKIAKKHSEENISFYQMKKNGVITLRTYERGVGFTYSCGSASLAVAAHYFKMHKRKKKVTILTQGGQYEIENHGEFLRLKGEVYCVFIGRYINEVS